MKTFTIHIYCSGQGIYEPLGRHLINLGAELDADVWWLRATTLTADHLRREISPYLHPSDRLYIEEVREAA